jgi:hypothetical protein
MSEGREEALTGLDRSFKIPKDVVNVMAQTKQPGEDIAHLNANVKSFKEMAKTPKEKKKS